MVKSGECLSVPRLKARAHIGTTAARAFLRGRGVPPAPHGPVMPLSTGKRLCQAYEHLVTQGGSISLRRLRQVAHVGMEAARAFLAVRRACLPPEEQGSVVSVSCEMIPIHPF